MKNRKASSAWHAVIESGVGSAFFRNWPNVGWYERDAAFRPIPKNADPTLRRQNSFRLSTSRVTGPSLTSSTSMWAWKRPVAV